MDITSTRGIDFNGKIISVPLTKTSEGNIIHFTVKQADAAKCAQLDILPQVFTAEVNTDGYFLMPNWHNGVISTFKEISKKEYNIHPSLYFSGIKKDGKCYVIIMENMKYDSIFFRTYKKGIHEAFFSFTFSAEHFEPYSDITFSLYELDGKSEYSDMAAVYREYKLAHGMKSIKDKHREAVDYAAEAPEIRVRMGWKPVPTPVLEQTNENEPEMHVAVTFAKLREIMQKSHDAGLEKAEFCLVGWNVSGHDGCYPQMFPVEEKLGGEEELKKTIAFGQSLGYKVVCHTNSTDAYSIADCFDINDLVFNSDLKPETMERGWSGGRMYHLSPKKALENAKEMLPRVRALGFEGLHYIDVLSIIRAYRDFNPAHKMTKTDSIEAWKQIISLARDLFGGIASEGCFDTLAEDLDFCLYTGFKMFQNTSEYIDSVVPMWQLVFHGSVLSCPTSELVNISLCPRELQLRFIEFGGRPAMYIYSRFVTECEGSSNWMGDDDLTCATDEETERTVRILKETYDFYKPLSHLQYYFMTKHEILENGLVAVSYSNGETVYINYSDTAAVYNGITIGAQDYIIV